MQVQLPTHLAISYHLLLDGETWVVHVDRWAIFFLRNKVASSWFAGVMAALCWIATKAPALSELVELAFTQIIRLAMTERRGSDSSISFHQLSGFAFLFMGSYPCDVTVHAWPWMAGSPHISVVRCMSFSWRTHPEVRAFFALSHLASRLTSLFGELATGLHVHERDACCYDFVDKRFSAKVTDRLIFPLKKSQRTTTFQNATQHWLDLHLQRQPLIPLRVSETWQAKNIAEAFCYLLCARYFLQPRVCPCNAPV